jgi:type I restriction enzyme, S subunit
MSMQKLDKQKLPTNWKTVKLGEVCEVKHGKSQKEVIHVDGIYSIFSSSGKMNAKSKSFLYEKDSVLIGRKGTIDKPQYVNEPFWAIDTVFFTKPKQNIDTKWLYYKFLEIPWKNYNEASGLPSLSASTISNDILFNLPPLEEQKKIASCLCAFDSGIQKLASLIELKKKVKKGLMQVLLKPFEKEDEGQKNLPEWFKSSIWKSVKLGEVGEIKTSSVDKLSHDNELKMKLLNYMDVYKRNYIYKNDTFQEITATEKEIQTFNIKKGDVFFTPSSETPNDIGHSAVALDGLEDVLYSYHLVRFRPNNGIFNIKYLGYCFRTEKTYREFTINAQGATRYTLSISAFQNLQISLPPLEVQQKIASILSKADKEVEALQQKLQNLKTQKKGLMQILLTGEVRFKEFI